MTLAELLRKLLAVCPQGSMEEDNYGQIVFYTDLRSVDGINVETFLVDDSDDDSEKS